MMMPQTRMTCKVLKIFVLLSKLVLSKVLNSNNGFFRANYQKMLAVRYMNFSTVKIVLNSILISKKAKSMEHID